MKLYVGTYKKYNEGSLFGEWLDLDDYSDKDDFIEACLELHKDEEEPELMFQDYEAENDLEAQFYNESYISESYWTVKEALDDSSLDADLLGKYISYVGFDDIEKGIKSAENNYIGTYDSEIAYAESVVEEDLACFSIKDSFGRRIELPSYIVNAIDYKYIARELSYDCIYIETDNHETAVFNHY